VTAVSEDPRILAPGTLPTPFTADEIRDGSPVGKTIRLLIEMEGKDPIIRLNRWVECDADGATVEKTKYSLAGDRLGRPDTERSTWLELQEHASFRSDVTTMERERIETPLGLLDCIRYTVVDGQSVDTFWFWPSAPGMPVKYTSAEDGRVTSSVTVIERTLP
jgi:hypothetical protein